MSGGVAAVGRLQIHQFPSFYFSALEAFHGETCVKCSGVLPLLLTKSTPLHTGYKFQNYPCLTSGEHNQHTHTATTAADWL
jgi:hypothetical protein